MERHQPEYLAKPPKDRSGMALLAVVAIVLAITLVGGWKLYMGTVAGWERRFNTPTPVKTTRTEEAPVTAEEVRAMKARFNEWQRAHEAARAYDKCVGHTAFRKLANGGWENVPGLYCETEPGK